MDHAEREVHVGFIVTLSSKAMKERETYMILSALVRPPFISLSFRTIAAYVCLAQQV